MTYLSNDQKAYINFEAVFEDKENYQLIKSLINYCGLVPNGWEYWNDAAGNKLILKNKKIKIIQGEDKNVSDLYYKINVKQIVDKSDFAIIAMHNDETNLYLFEKSCGKVNLRYYKLQNNHYKYTYPLNSNFSLLKFVINTYNKQNTEPNSFQIITAELPTQNEKIIKIINKGTI